MKANLEQLYEQLKLVTKNIEFAKQGFNNSVRIRGSNSRKILVDDLSEKCDEIRNQTFDLLNFINDLMECEDESELETLIVSGGKVEDER